MNAAAGDSRFEQHVLIVEGQPHVVHREPAVAEETRQRTGSEVRAMLVVDVPEGAVAQDATDVGDFAQDPHAG